jgi:hypothetical protein
VDLSEEKFQLEEIRARSEALQEALAEEYYESTAGLKAESDVSTIYRRHEGVISREAIAFVQKRLAAALERGKAGPGESESEREDEARRLRYLLEFQTDEFVGSEVKSIIDEILTRESALKVKLGEEEIAFRKLALEIANARDRGRREALERAQVAAVEELTPLLAERIGIENGIARSMGQPSYAALWQATAGIDLLELDRICQAFLARTDDMYKEAMGWAVRKRLGMPLSDARRHDLLAIFRGEEFDDFFPKGDMLGVAKRCLAEMDVDIAAGGNISFDLEPRERKSQRAFSAVLEVPRRVVLVLAPEGGRRDWQQLLHELGHCLHYGYTAPEAAYEYRRLGDYSLTETFAFLFQYLLTDKGFLKRYLGIARPRDFLFLAYLEKLTYLRRYAAKLHYELALHGGQAGVEGKDALYEENLVGALKVRYPRELFLYDVDRSFYAARYLRAWNMEALLSKHLTHYFDEDWYRNPRAGTFLKKHWAIGQRFRVEEMARAMGYKDLGTAELEQELVKNL